MSGVGNHNRWERSVVGGLPVNGDDNDVGVEVVVGVVVVVAIVAVAVVVAWSNAGSDNGNMANREGVVLSKSWQYTNIA